MSSDREDVLAANAAFYAAFGRGDMDAMSEVWAETGPVACLHPGAPLLVGRDPVLNSWSHILGASEMPEIACFEPHAYLMGHSAFVTCYERLGGVGGAVLIATNIFIRENDRWRMSHHHASPAAVAPPERAGDAKPTVLH